MTLVDVEAKTKDDEAVSIEFEMLGANEMYPTSIVDENGLSLDVEKIGELFTKKEIERAEDAAAEKFRDLGTGGFDTHAERDLA